MILNCAHFQRLTKDFGRSLDGVSLDQVLEHFIGSHQKYRRQLTQCFLSKLLDIEEFITRQRLYHIFASSILFSYDWAALETIDWDTEDTEQHIRDGWVENASIITFIMCFLTLGAFCLK